MRGDDLPYWSKIFNASGPMVDWMQSIGIGFTTMGIRHGSTPFLAPGPYQGGAGYAMEYLADRITKKGGRIIYSTPVTELIQAEDGTVTGVVAEGEDGVTWTVHADVTLLASGGFGANQEMVAQYYPQYATRTFNCAKGARATASCWALKRAVWWSAWAALWARSSPLIRANMSWPSCTTPPPA